MHFIQRKQFSETNETSPAFQNISDLKIFPECIRGPLETLWLATGGSRACSWTTLSYIKPYTGNMTLSIVCYAIR